MTDTCRLHSWCTEHETDSDGTQSCTAIEEVGEWDVVLNAITGEPTRVWPEHPAIIRVDDEATLTPRAAIELGLALIRQGMLGLEPADVARSDEMSGSVPAIASRSLK